MKVIATKEAHDVTTLSLDELFKSLRTFEIALSDIEESKVKSVLFNLYMEMNLLIKEKLLDQVNESIVMLTKQFSNVIKKINSPNNYGSNNRSQNNFRRREFD